MSVEKGYTFVSIGQADELSSGERWLVDIDALSIAVFRVGDQYYAIGDLCSHDQGAIGDGELDGYEIVCPRHGARFDIRNGKVLRLPALADIPVYPVKIEAGELLVGIPA